MGPALGFSASTDSIRNVTARATPTSSRSRARSWGRALLAAALLVALVVGSRGITDEGSVTVQGDMPRYLMDGVFLYDFLASGSERTVAGSLTYAQHYFARYPALSLGHHAPLLPISLVPFYAIFGVSVFAARVAAVAFFMLSVLLLYTLVARVYDDEVAGWACLLFASSPVMARFAQTVLSEMPAIALVLGTLNALMRFRDSGRFRDFILFVVLAVISLTARQLAIFMFPAYAALLLTQVGWSRLARRDVVLFTLGGLFLVIPIAIATVMFSPFNVAVVIDVFRQSLSVSQRLALLRPIFRLQLRPALGILAATALSMALVDRDRRIMVGVYWIVAILAGVLLVTGPVEPVRYSIIAVPAYCLCAASLLRAVRTPGPRRGLTAVLMLAVAWQLWWGHGVRPPSEDGYEEAARFVLADSVGQPAPAVLYSASVDTGAFVFFVRKHDPAQRLVVIRSDKLLTTSFMGRVSIEDRIASPNEIYPLLDRFGIKFVVIEDRPSGSAVLDWLRDELKGARFIERRRIAFDRAEDGLAGASLVAYEYKDARPPDSDAELDLKLPVVGREIRVRLSDLRPADSQ